MKLHNRKSYIETLPEGVAPPNNKIHITRWIYFSVLASLASYLIYMISAHLIYVEGTGQVEIDKTNISLTRSGQLVTLAVQAGDRVTRGQLLARVAPIHQCDQEPDSKIEKLRLDTEIKQQQLKLLHVSRSASGEPVGENTVRRALEVDREHLSEQRRKLRAYAQLTEKIHLLTAEVSLQQQQLQKLEYLDAQQQPPPECVDELLYAPFDGQVNAVLKQQYEYSRRGEPLMILEPEVSPIRIEAYFEENDLPHLALGKQVKVTLPDNQTSSAVIDKIHASAYAAPQRETKHYQPLAGGVRVELRPQTADEEQLWRNFDRLAVQVRIER